MGTYWLDADDSSTVASGIPYRQLWFAACSRCPASAWLRRRPVARRITPAGRGEHGFGDGRKRENLLGRAEFDRFARHAVDHTSGFVLRDGAGAGLAHFQQSLGAIVTHAGEQDSHRVGAGRLGHR